MKILVVCDVLFPQTVGGAGRVAREVAEALLRRGEQVRFVTRFTDSTKSEGSIPIEYLPPVWMAPFGAFQRVFEKQLREFSPDIVHAHQPLPAYFLSRSRLNSPLVYTFHSSWPQELMLKSSPWPMAFRRFMSAGFAHVERRVVASASEVIVLSRFSHDEVRRLCHREPVLIPGGVNTMRFKPRKREVRQTSVRLITLRNLVPRMGLDELIKAMTSLPSDVFLEIGGEGPLRPVLQRLIDEAGLKERVRLLGHVAEEKLPEFYSSADFFVLPTVALEGFGLVILESLACGTPVLGTRIGAIPELLERFNREWIIPSPNAVAISRTVTRALESPRPDRDELHQRVAAEFGWDAIGAKHAELFSRVRSRVGSPQ